jgi:RNA polymerase sigma-70 factor, ECF subfamily
VRGGPLGLSELFETYRDPLTRYAARRVGPEHGADVVSETFLVALNRPNDVPSNEDALMWLYAVARNHIRNHYRTEQKWILESHPELVVDRDSIDIADEIATRVDLLDALSNLHFDDAELLRLMAWEDLNPTDAAKVLGCSSTAFRVRLHRARSRLRKQLELTKPHLDTPPIRMKHDEGAAK